jgi:RNA polymerase sigma factor (sigma-70 family)
LITTQRPQLSQRTPVTAVEEVVRRHSGWIYAAALRRSGDRHLADDITQAVFIVLWQRWDKLPAQRPLAPWLFRVMRYAVSNAVRQEQRRHKRERTAAAMRAKCDSTPGAENLNVELDELLTRLSARDRDAVLLRYYEGRSFGEIARGLGIGEDAARKRVDRAIEKLRQQLVRRGVGVTAASVASALALDASAPAHAVALVNPGANGVAIAAGVTRQLASAKLRIAAALASAVIVIGALSWLGARASAPAAATLAAPPPAKAFAAVRVTDKGIAGANIPAPWPLALPGSITAAPVVADLEGNGTLCVVVPCESFSDAALVHPSPQYAVLLYAFHADGSPVAGWPVTLLGAGDRENIEAQGRLNESWSSSPSVCTDRAGKTRIVITTPYFQGFRIISPDGKVRAARGGSQWASVPLIDIDRDGEADIVTGAGILSIERRPVRGFGADHPIATLSGYAPCIGDANGDGRLEVYHLFADTLTNLRDGSAGYVNELADIMAYDQDGKPLPGWPQAIGKGKLDAYPPVMGDVAGDAKMEIVATDNESVHAWTWDGKPLVGGDGVFQRDVSPANTSPTLADLDGDGKAEIIIFDQAVNAIRAWHGDGTAVTGDSGIIAKLPTSCCGVSVADLGGDGIIDLFAGTYWVKFTASTGSVTVTNMLPAEAEINSTQPTICDLDNDGQADILFGLKNGAVVVYQSHLPYKRQWMQWPTVNGNFQHTGCAPSLAAAAMK